MVRIIVMGKDCKVRVGKVGKLLVVLIMKN